MKETGLLAPLGKPEKFHDKDTLRSIFDRWVRELAPAIETAGPRPSPDERLLRAIFGQEPIDHPANLLEELIGAVQKLADSRG